MFTHSTGSSQKEKQPALPMNTVKGLFAFRGETLTGWARANGYSAQIAHMAVKGKRRGPMSQEIVRRLKKELGL
jgi:hypothetical protein